MSGLWLSLLEQIRILGNNSGCHQRPDRSFFIKGKQFPVCARCTGVFLGQLMAVILEIKKKNKSIKLSGALLMTMGLDWFLQEIGLRESTNIRRLITGFMGGLGLFGLYFAALRGATLYLKRWICPY